VEKKVGQVVLATLTSLRVPHAEMQVLVKMSMFDVFSVFQFAFPPANLS